LTTKLTSEFKKSPFSGRPPHLACVEVAHQNGTVKVRDSKDPNGPQLSFSEAEWVAFIRGAMKGEFNL
jgi:hypothetical protein